MGPPKFPCQLRRVIRLSTIIAVGLLSILGCRRSTPPSTQAAAKGVPATEPAKPNVVLISVDTLRPDHLGCYGYHRATSPRIDQLAAQGALFENTISSTSWTLPAHAAMLTSLADTVHGCTDTDKRLEGHHTTLAECLATVNYATAGFFSGPYLHPAFGFAQGFETYLDCTAYPTLEARARKDRDNLDMRLKSQQDITNPRVYEQVSLWLKQNHRRPFFLFVHMWDVHFDLIPPAPYDTMFDPNYTGTINGRNFFFNPIFFLSKS